jgi:hypothetical protein
MRRDNVMDIEVYLALYDMQDLRDHVYKNGQPYVINIIFHAWLFPELSYRQSAEVGVEAAIFESSGVFPVANEPEDSSKACGGLTRRSGLRTRFICAWDQTPLDVASTDIVSFAPFGRFAYQLVRSEQSPQSTF